MHHLTKNFFTRIKNGQLAPFYILSAEGQYTYQERKIILEKWCHDLVNQYAKTFKFKFIDKQNQFHPDILFIKNTENTTDTTHLSESFKPFFKFMNMASFELPHRFIFIFDAHLLTPLILNKMLKSLEEPPEKTTILFTLPKNMQLLSTIESRALRLLVNQERPALHKQNNARLYNYTQADNATDQLCTWAKQFLDTQLNGPQNQLAHLIVESFYDKNKFHEIIEICQKNNATQDELLHILFEINLHKKSCYQDKDNFLKQCDWYATSKTFHNSYKERLYSLLDATFSL